jgi:sporulation protein YunB
MVKFRRYPRGFLISKFKKVLGKPNVSKPSSQQFKPKNYREKRLPFRYVLLLSFVFFVLSTSIGLWVVNKGLRPTLESYAESQSVNLATYVINKAVKDEIGAGLNLNEIIKVVPTGAGNGTYTAIDTEIILDVTNRITSNILNNINSMEEGESISTAIATNGEVTAVHPAEGHGIHFEVPFGRITDNILLAHLGPNIPVEFQAIGHIEYDYETITKNHQINSTWYEIRLNIEVGIQMLVPFSSDMIIIPQSILLASGEVKGEVPQFYSNGTGGVMPYIQAPKEEENE